MCPIIVGSALYISCAVSNFYGTEIEIWAGFGPVGSTKKNWADYEQPLRAVFSCFQGQKYCSITEETNSQQKNYYIRKCLEFEFQIGHSILHMYFI